MNRHASDVNESGKCDARDDKEIMTMITTGEKPALCSTARCNNNNNYN